MGGGAEFPCRRNRSGGRNGHGGTKFHAWNNDSIGGNTDLAHGTCNTTIGHYLGNNGSAEHNSVNAGYNANSGHHDSGHCDTEHHDTEHHDTEHHDTEYGQPKHNYPEHNHTELDYAEHGYTRSAG